MITSKNNTFFKLYKSLMVKKYRDQHGLFLVYGKHLIEAARHHGALKTIITDNPDLEGTLMDPALFKELQQTETHIEQIGVCEKINPKIVSRRVLILEDIQDPDNLGALIRSASAFGFLHVIMSPKCADLYNEKAIRASKGALFDVYVERLSLEPAIMELKKQGYQMLCTSPHKGTTGFPDTHLAVILGNEGRGVSLRIQELADHWISIETQRVEILNVSVAGGFIMHQWRLL